ncbi:alkaline phosphatase D family protein [Stenotrophomonas tumulicola]|uniref:Alkaline phosphatase D family protein n=2 Tax=Stenotrophomonas tumulicola TaxID=1685415 RepID=A0A7W3FQQ9_9GAMM|nr:alkaline phosphatase D family protein [Stenotrophomonas tumulicola]MBA8683895.1 alkaline phosphatase D family protein [Stenotrophomonas tumulicola]
MQPVDAAGRRRLLQLAWQGTGAAIALAALPGLAVAGPRPRLGRDPFTLGVASGDPDAQGAVLWTRLAPEPLLGGGMPSRAVPVRWFVAEDPGMRRVVQRGVAAAVPELAHSVHVEVMGLQPGRDYFYRFSCDGDEESPIGHFRTTPLPDARLDRLQLALCSCQAWNSGYYPVLADIARSDVDLVLHAGDYLYEYSPLQNARGVVLDAQRFSGETTSLQRYRDQYALYKLDPDLQAAHAAHAFAVIWDDHEVQNDYSGITPEKEGGSLETFIARRAAAYRAFYEHLPVRRAPTTNGGLRIHRQLRYGDLAQLTLLDCRQFRPANPCGVGETPRCAAALDPRASMLGVGQEAWFEQAMASAAGLRWNVVVQQLLMAQLKLDAGTPRERFWNDAWDGYPLARCRMLEALHKSGQGNGIVLGGDWHSSFVNDLKLDFDVAGDAVVATEFVAPAISSGGDDTPYGPYYGPSMPMNPHIRYFDGDRRGWWRMEFARDTLQAELRFADSVLRPDAVVAAAAGFQVERGRPGARRTL